MREYFTDGSLDEKICMSVPWGGGLVDYDKLIALKVVDESGSRVDGQGGAADYENIRLVDIPDRGIYGLLVKAFFIQYNIRFYRAAALLAFWNALGFQNIGNIMKLSAGLAVVAQDGAMKLQNRLAARRLVQAVDVLDRKSVV